MSETNENTISTLPQPASPDPALPQPALSPAAEPHERDLPSASRPSKSALLAEAAELSLEGHSSRAISRKLRVPRQTVDRWLAQQRQQWMESASENAAELFATALARLESIYREAMEAWRSSLADKEVTLDTFGGDGKESRTLLRTETKSGQAALLGKAIQAAKEICAFKAKHLDGVKRAEARDREQVRRDLAGELGGLPKQDKRELVAILKTASHRQPAELAKILNSLPAEEYRELRELVDFDSDFVLPLR